MRQKTRQIKFYCNEDDYETFQAIKNKTNSSTQELMLEALQSLFFTHAQYAEIDDEQEELNRKAKDAQTINHLLDTGLITSAHESFELRKGESSMVHLWIDCMRRLPDATVFAIKQIMHDTLKFLASSRLQVINKVQEGRVLKPESSELNYSEQARLRIRDAARRPSSVPNNVTSRKQPSKKVGKSGPEV